MATKTPRITLFGEEDPAYIAKLRTSAEQTQRMSTFLNLLPRRPGAVPRRTRSH